MVSFLNRDLPRALREVDDLSLLADLDDAATLARTSIDRYVGELEEDVAPRAKATFRLGRDRIEQKLRLDDGVTLDIDKLLRIANRELSSTRARFAAVAAKMGKGPADQVWSKLKTSHVEAGGLVTRVREQCAALYTFLRDSGIVTVPDADALVIAPTPPFYRWTFASLWAPGPLEVRPQRSYYYITEVDPGWPQDRQEEHLRDMNDAVLWSISMHEALPGHFLHFEHLRKVASPWRKATVLAPMSLLEGWAHYAEHLVVEQGFAEEGSGGRARPIGRVARPARRLVVGLRLHAEDLSVEQGVRLFREEAMLEEGSARREAERGAFDPSYVDYALGKLMLLKLATTSKPIRAPGSTSVASTRTSSGSGCGRSACCGSRCSVRPTTASSCQQKVKMPLYEYQCGNCGHRFKVIEKFSDPLVPSARSAAGGAQAAVVAGHPVQGVGLLHHRLRQEEQHARRVEQERGRARRARARGRAKSGGENGSGSGGATSGEVEQQLVEQRHGAARTAALPRRPRALRQDEARVRQADGVASCRARQRRAATAGTCQVVAQIPRCIAKYIVAFRKPSLLPVS